VRCGFLIISSWVLIVRLKVLHVVDGSRRGRGALDGRVGRDRESLIEGPKATVKRKRKCAAARQKAMSALIACEKRGRLRVFKMIT